MSTVSISKIIWPIATVVAFALGWAISPKSEPNPTSPEGKTRKVTLLTPTSLRAAGTEANGENTELVTDDRLQSFTLTRASIDQLGETFRKSGDPIERRLAFSKLLEGMTLDNALEIREQVEHMPANSSEFIEFHYAWGKIGGTDAIMHGADTKKPDMVATLAGWTSADPAAALDWFNSLEESSKESFASRDYMKMGVLHGLSDMDPAAAVDFARDFAKNEKETSHMTHAIASKVLRANGPEGAATWATNLPDGDIKNKAIERIAHDYGRQDPIAAVAWLESFDGNAGSGAYRTTFETWAGRDPQAASEYIVEMPQSSQKNHAISGLVNRHRWEDPTAAIAWAGEISDKGGRERALYQAGEAYLRKSPEAAREWLPNSGLSVEAQQKLQSRRR